MFDFIITKDDRVETIDIKILSITVLPTEICVTYEMCGFECEFEANIPCDYLEQITLGTILQEVKISAREELVKQSPEDEEEIYSFDWDIES